MAGASWRGNHAALKEVYGRWDPPGNKIPGKGVGFSGGGTGTIPREGGAVSGKR